jgi:uncharacterized protein with ParB-like and HNH nuclease domain
MLEEHNIISVEKMLTTLQLEIPDYQRPYKWGKESIRYLVNDIKESMDRGKKEYRIGTIILHKNKDREYKIVDGQQRLISLTILLYALDEKNSCLLRQKREFSKISQRHIKDNYETILDLLNNNNIDTLEYTNYILTKCEFVMIVTYTEKDAFQFFDSQNSRGKPLYPHDLLKAHHLREMVGENSDIDDATKNIITNWENIDKERLGEVSLADLFKYYIYPIKQWIKLKDGLGKTPNRGNLSFDSKKIDAFKGISAKNHYDFTKYHRRNQGNYDIEYKDIFQLDQEIIAGEPFFHFVLRYHRLLKKIQDIIRNSGVPGVRNENYVKKLYESALLLYVDRFDDKLEEIATAIKFFFRWAYYLRIDKDRVGELSINKYAIEEQMFQIISDAVDPDDIFSIELRPLEERHKNKEKYSDDFYKYLIDEKAAI